MKFLPLTDLSTLRFQDVRADLVAAMTVTFIAIPQGVAYAMIAGLPPAVGLYASFLPAIVGALFRSSRHVITGPSNALSLLVGTGVAAALAASSGGDPETVALGAAVAMAFLVGVFQVSAGALRLGVLVDYISTPVVAGYITGAGVLIGIGQLPNATGTAGGSGSAPERILAWLADVASASPITVAVALGTTVAIATLRRIDKRIPAALLVLAAATIATWLFDLGPRGLSRIYDLSPTPSGLPTITLPDLEGWRALLPFAVAATVLSLVESAAVARTLSIKSGQRLDLSTEFTGQGLANIAASVSSGYPTSASLARSTLNINSGARSRLSGVLTGVLVGASLLFFAPAIDYTPIAALAGLLFVLAWDLVDVARIRSIVLGRPSDAIAFAATVIGTWVLSLDQAIYFGVVLSLFFYLRRARFLRTSYLRRTPDGGIAETSEPPDDSTLVIDVNGQLFFAAVRELDAAIEAAVANEATRCVILRLRRALGMDVTVALRLAEVATNMRESGKRLVLTGVGSKTRRLLDRVGALEQIGAANVYDESEQVFDGVTAAISEFGDEQE